MPLLNIKLKSSNTATPALETLRTTLKKREGFHKKLAGTLEDVTRDHIRSAATTRHKTATRLSASPTGYLTRLAETTETHSDNQGVVIRISGAIFRRVLGPVVVQPVQRKWLAIPARADAYGRRPGEFSNLRFVKFSETLAALVDGGITSGYKSRAQKKKPKKAKPHKPRALKRDDKIAFWLKKKTTLPQDRELIPSEQKHTAAAELAAREFIQEQADALRAKRYGGL